MSDTVTVYNPKNGNTMEGRKFSLEPHPVGQNMFLTLDEEDAEVFSDTDIRHFVFHHQPENQSPPPKAFRVLETSGMRGIMNDDGSTSYDIVVTKLSAADPPE